MAQHTPPRLGGTVFGVTFALAFGVGSLAPAGMGVVGGRLGLAAVFVQLGLVSVLAVALATAFIGRTGTRRLGRRPAG